MHDRTSTPTTKRPKRPRDINQIAYAIVQEATGQAAATQPVEPNADPIKAAAATLGRLGGKKGGLARAKKLSPQERRRIAQVAAAARWKKD